MDFYSINIKTPTGKKIAMSDFEGKVVLVVNTATECLLSPQFDGLENLHQAYKDKGLVIIGTPCNQFGNQEPLKNEDLVKSCLINHGVTFQLTEKINVNGPKTHPLFKYLKEELGSLLGKNIKWNFTKFLIDRNGNPYKRYAPTTLPSRIESDILKLLG
jgi:glutathione peroxidase